MGVTVCVLYACHAHSHTLAHTHTHTHTHTHIPILVHANSNANSDLLNILKAFDAVYHDILLKSIMGNMEHYGVRGLANDWFHSYLTYRKQYVSINDFDSKLWDVKYGVPQGSLI